MNDYEDYILGGAGYIPYLKETINPNTQKHTSTDYVDEECNRLVEEQGYISRLGQLV